MVWSASVSAYSTILDSEGKTISQMRMNDERMLSYMSNFNVGKVAMESSNQLVSLDIKLASQATKEWNSTASHSSARALNTRQA